MQPDHAAQNREPAAAQYNLAYQCCGRWAAERTRLAMYYEDQSGLVQAYGYWDIQRAANRLSNALGALGTLRGERIAIILPQRPEAAIAHIACYQMGAVAVPLSPLLGREALTDRLGRSAARIALVDAEALSRLVTLRGDLPQLRHIIGVGGATQSGMHAWSRLLEYASPRYTPLATAAAAPALEFFGRSDHGKPQAVPFPHDTLPNFLPDFIRAHEAFPQTGDLFWSSADWDCPGGLFGAWLPAWNLGQPILVYSGPFDAQKACWLMAKYGVRNACLSAGELDSMRQAVPRPREQYGPDLNLRTLVSSGAAVDETLQLWVQKELGVRIGSMQARYDT